MGAVEHRTMTLEIVTARLNVNGETPEPADNVPFIVNACVKGADPLSVTG